MKKLILAIAVMLFKISAFAQNTDALLNSYLTVKNALVMSDGKAAGKAISNFHEAVKSENNFDQKADLLKVVEKLSKTGSDLEKQRAAFNDVSVAMWRLVKSAGKVNHTVYYEYCPMKKAYWISNEQEIKNPYFGSSMLTCGKVVETKQQ